MTQVLAGQLLTAGLRSEFADSYRMASAGVERALGSVMDLGIPSDKLTEIFGYFETAPYPVRWRRGDAITEKGFASVQFSITNYDYGRRVQWHENDRQDDQTRTLMEQARTLGAHFASLPSRIFYQMLTAGTDYDLLPTVPNAADGVGLFSATASDSSARFGLTGGNIQTGTGVATAAAIRTDFFNAIERFVQFQDTEGQPLFPAEIIDQGFDLFYNAANMQIVAEAFVQGRTLAAATTATSNAAVTNIVMDSGLEVRLHPTQRITDNDMFVNAGGSPKKPLFQLQRQTLREHVGTMDNSDTARATKLEYMQWDVRQGYGIAVPYGIVKINNS